MEKIKLTKSKALRTFKNQIGQSNHFLITILIGLDGVGKGLVEKDEGFSTSWHPKDLKNSVIRSREFAIKSALSWCIDSLDSFFIMTQREPKLIQLEEFRVKYGQAGHSVYKKLLVYCDYLSIDQTDVERSLVELAITWRNRMVHNFAENELPLYVRNNLLNKKQYIKENYNGLDIELSINNMDSYPKNPPKFKEVTSLISAVINLVYRLDQNIIMDLDKTNYVLSVIKHYVTLQSKNKNSSLQKILKEIWSIEKERKIYNILSQYGFEYNKNGTNIDYIDDIINQNIVDIMNELNFDLT